MVAHRSPRLVLAALVCAAISPLAPAQTLDDVVPIAGAPGDLVILRGTGLGATTSVEFAAKVGGFVISETISVAPIAVSATEVLAIVPAFQAFLGTMSGPHGTIRVTPPAGEKGFFYMEATFGALSTPGVGTTQVSGVGKPVISFDTLGLFGLPLGGWPSFDLYLDNATPGSIALAVVSLPATPPYLPIGDGQLVVNLSTMVVIAPVVTHFDGHATMGVPVPTGVTGAFVYQWGLLEAGSGALAVSNGLQVVLP